MKYVENKNKTVYNIDLDGTLTNNTVYELSSVIPERVELVRDLYYSGNIVIIWTARQWSEAPKVIGFLETHSIPYHGLKMSKGGSDVYVDDKCYSPELFFVRNLGSQKNKRVERNASKD